MSDEVDLFRRRFLSTAGISIASAQLGMIGFSEAQSKKEPSDLPKPQPVGNKSFGPLRQIDAGSLNIDSPK